MDSTARELDRLTIPDTATAAFDWIEDAFTKGLTDGLPVVPPTEQRVKEMVAASGRKATEVIGHIPPRHGIATVEAIAANAAMAGCKPEYLPVVLAAVEAVLEERFNMKGMQVTTGPWAPLIIVSPKLASELGVNSGENVFGYGFRANATIGRALRLTLINLGGVTPSAIRSTLGHPGMFTFCIGESPESPWEPVHADLGLCAERAVTVFATESPRGSRPSVTPKATLDVLASTMSTLGTNNLRAGGQMFLVLTPSTANALAADGWRKEDVRYYLFEKARVNKRRMLDTQWQSLFVEPERYPKWVDALSEEDGVPVVRRWDNLHIVVCGGKGHAFSAVLPGWGYFGGWAVTRPVNKVAADSPATG